MSNRIKLKRGTGSNPSTSDLVVGEVALRTDNGKLFTKKDDGNIAEIGTGLSDGDKGDLTISNGGTTFTIDSGVINNAKVASDAAIAGSKISPDFGSQNIVTSGTIKTTGNQITIEGVAPVLTFTETNDNPDFQISGNGGALTFKDTTNNAERLKINTDGHVDVLGNLDVGAGIDVTGAITSTGHLTITNANPAINLVDNNNNPDYQICNINGALRFRDTTNTTDRILINTDGHVDIAGNLDVGAGIDVTGNIDITDGTLIIDTTPDSPNTSFGLQEALRIDDNGATNDRHFSIYEYRQGGGRFFSINMNLTSGSTGSAYQYTQGNWGGSSMIRFNNGATQIFADDQVTGGSNDVITPTERFKVNTNGVVVTGNISVTGTVDGVDIAARNTLFGGLTSSSGVLTNGVTATTQAQSDNSTKVSTTAYVRTAVSNLVNSAPSTLDTLKELSDALGADANFSTTVTNSIATKLPLAGGTLTGDLTINKNNPVITFSDDNNNPDYQLGNINGVLRFQDTTNNATRLQINTDGHVDFLTNVDFASGIDVTGATTLLGDGNASVAWGDTSALGHLSFTATDGNPIVRALTGKALVFQVNMNTTAMTLDSNGNTSVNALTINSTTPILSFQESDGNPDYRQYVEGGAFHIEDITNSNAVRLKINTDGHIDITAGLDITSGGLDVTGNITVTGTVDGRDVAADGTKLDAIEGNYVREIQTQNDITTRFDSGFYETSTATTGEGWPETTNGWYHLIAKTHSNTANYYSMQIAGGFFNQKFYIRSTHNSGTRAWSKIWTSSSDGAGSGLDSDTVDGIEGASFLRSDANDTATGDIEFTGHVRIVTGDIDNTNTTKGLMFDAGYEDGRYRTRIRKDDKGGGIPLYIDSSDGTANSYTAIARFGGYTDNTEKFEVFGTAKATTFSGSGASLTNIPAGQLTGTIADARIPDIITPATRVQTSEVRTGNGQQLILNAGESNGKVSGQTGEYVYVNAEAGLSVNTPDSANANWQGGTASDQTLITGTAITIDGNTVFHQGNDGSGSGLDADKVDGIQGASLLRSDANDTYTGTLSLAGHIVDSGDSRSVKLMGGTTNSQPFLGIGEQSLYGMKIRWDSSQSIEFDGFWNTSVDGARNKDLGSINVNTSTWNFPAATFSNGINVGDLANGGITGNNYDITGVNSLAFNDPGEGIIFKSGLTLILIDDDNDNICNFDGAAELRVNNSKVWHAGNDGSASGLDSDKLDGQEGSYYRNAGNINAGTLNAARLPNHSAALLTSGTIPDARISSNFMKSNATSNANLNTAQSAGVYRLNTGITNGTSGINSYGTLLNCNNGSDTGFQIYANYNSDNYFIRGGNSSTFGGSGSNRAWAKIWNDQNDGSGSNLDADKVDGLQASQFVRSDANDTMTGTLTIGDGSAQTELHIKKADNNVSDHLQFYNGTTRMGEIGCEDGTWLRINQETAKNIYTPRLFRADGGFQVDAITVIDGSANVIGARVSGTVASATDADTVDGLQASSFIRSDANDNVTGHTEWQDSYEVRLGAGADMRLYHNGSQSYIDNHTSHLYIRNAGSNDNANIYIQARDGENSIICEDDADVRLFSDNTEVFRTDTTNSCKVKHLYPWTNNAYNLGSTSLRWKNLYVQDMHFHNGEENPNKVDGTWGDWTLQEGENDIFMINNRSGKKFKIAMIPV